MDADGESGPAATTRIFATSYGAHFAEVGVGTDTGEVPVRRMLGVAVSSTQRRRSQAIGGMVFGVGAALHER
jgi:xanthine dehydrogenase YagR molybdenum-binding subunit